MYYLVIKDDGYHFSYEEFSTLSEALSENYSYCSDVKLFEVHKELNYYSRKSEYDEAKLKAISEALKKVKAKLTPAEMKLLGL